jgi:hypothetical protein
VILFFSVFFANVAIATDRTDFQDALSKLSALTQATPLNCEITNESARADHVSFTLDFGVNFKDAFFINFKLLDSRSELGTLIAYEGTVPGYVMGRLTVSNEGDVRTYRHISNGVVKDVTLLVVGPKQFSFEYRKLDVQRAPIIELRCVLTPDAKPVEVLDEV